MEFRSVWETGLDVLHSISSLLLTLVSSLWPAPRGPHLRGKRVLVTGASAGIGEQLAYRYASLGAQVLLTARREAVLAQVAQRCTELSPTSDVKHHVISADMADLDSCDRLVKEAVSLLGGLDVLVLNHITPSPISPFTGSAEDLKAYHRVITVNLDSFVHLTAHSLPALTASEGRIVVVNSLVGQVPHPYLAPYCSSKHALNGFFHSLRNQLLAQGTKVSVTMANLGFIGTASSLQQLADSGSAHLLKTVKPASPKVTADVIVQAANQRRANVYYPYWSVRALVFLKGWLPQVVDRIMRDTTRLEATSEHTGNTQQSHSEHTVNPQ